MHHFLTGCPLSPKAGFGGPIFHFLGLVITLRTYFVETLRNLEGFWYLDPPRKNISQLRLYPRRSLAVAWNILEFKGKRLPGCNAFCFALRLRDVACARPQERDTCVLQQRLNSSHTNCGAEAPNTRASRSDAFLETLMAD